MSSNKSSVSQTIGLHASYGYRMPFEQRMQRLFEAGFRRTALWWEERRPEIRAMRDQAPDVVRSAGLKLDNLHAPYFACNALWSNDEDAIALHERWVRDCARHRVPRLVLHVTLGKSPPPPSPIGLESFKRLVDEAESTGVTLAIENTHSAAHVDYLLRNLDSPALGLCYDVAHDYLYSREPGGLMRAHGHRLAVLHLSDISTVRDMHWLPGDGRLDLDELAVELGTCGYSGSCIFEAVGRPRHEDVDSFLNRARMAAGQWHARIEQARQERSYEETMREKKSRMRMLR